MSFGNAPEEVREEERMKGTRQTRTMILGLVAALIVACGASEEDLGARLYELRSERTELMDQMYAEYEEVAGSVELPEILQAPGEEARRQWFELQVRTVGEGERPKLVPAAAREFLEREEVHRRARRVVELDREIERTERELQAVRGE
jgi:hypothetical protein